MLNSFYWFIRYELLKIFKCPKNYKVYDLLEKTGNINFVFYIPTWYKLSILKIQ